MYKTINVSKEVEETRKYCDVCGVEIRMGLACSVARCECCKKDLCDKCVGHEDCSCGDYRTVYCRKCWLIGEDFRAEIEYYEYKIEKSYEEWKQRCMCDKE